MSKRIKRVFSSSDQVFHLWAVLISKPEDIHATISEHDMVNNACRELITNIESQAKALTKCA
jgi:hypothetical protein